MADWGLGRSLGLLIVATLAACSSAAQQSAIVGAAPKVDHHQHLLSPALAQAWNQPEPVPAPRLITQLDAAGIQRAVVLSLAYAHGSPAIRRNDEYADVQAENDWTAEQVAQYPERLKGFCSVNPLRDYALAEIDRCSRIPNLRGGLKMQFANSQVNLRNGDHVQRLRRVFQSANEHRMALVVHVWTGNDEVGNPYDARDARTFLNEILLMAPDVPVQIAHLGGSGPRLDPGTKEAMLVFAEAAEAGGARARQLYFDITTNVISRSTREDADFVTARIRQIGVTRILYGSDMAIGGNAPAQESWQAHRAKLTLSEAEFRTIAENVAPYLRN